MTGCGGMKSYLSKYFPQEVLYKMSITKTTAKTRKPKVKPLPIMETVNCRICGNIVSKDESVEFDDYRLCDYCFDATTVICDCCDKRIWNDDNVGDYETRLCQNCYEKHYTRCGDCGIVINYDTAHRFEGNEYDSYCYYCYSKPRENVAIHNYSYKPAPIFYGDAAVNRYFGVELEIDDGGKENDNAYHLLQVANRTAETIYIKTDGSLNNGFEIVTHPMTLDYHMNEMS